MLTIKKTAVGIDKNDVISAGTDVDYKIVVSNAGGKAYDAQVFDTLVNPIGSVMNEQSWDLGTIEAGEEVELTYTTEYNPATPSGTYTNTAKVVAYLKDGMKEVGAMPLSVKEAVNTIQIKGLDLAIGNVEVLAYFPGVGGLSSALVSWETSKPSLSQMFYGLAQSVSPYDPKAANFGYGQASFKFPTEKTKHLMIITGLQNGRTYAYRINAQAGKFIATSREYQFTLPALVPTLTLAFPTTPSPMVAGASTSVPKPVAPVVPVYHAAPAPKPAAVTPPPAPEPAPTPEPEPKKEGGVVGFVKGVFGFFGR
jgi:hypothetical protein